MSPRLKLIGSFYRNLSAILQAFFESHKRVAVQAGGLLRKIVEMAQLCEGSINKRFALVFVTVGE